ncbi:MAG: hypothetical protein IJ532_05075 [Alphaproteobacteria bacterium]|nr:hypothetical protein [Alphaproteobacteria bacterium]
MKKYNKKILILVAVSYLSVTAPAMAVTKLEATGPAADIVNKIQKVKEKFEDIQTKIMKEKEKWTKKAEAFLDKTLGTEGAALFKQYVVEPGAGIVKSVAKGQYNAGDFSLSGFTSAIKSELGNYKLDFATLVSQAKDMANTAAKARLEKSRAIEIQVAKLQSEWDAKNNLNATVKSAQLEAELEELAKRISGLKEQAAQLNNKTLEETEAQKKMQEKMVAMQDLMASYSGKISQDDLLKKLNAEAMSLFTLKTDEEEDQAIYSASMEKLFLGKYDFGTSENLARIRRARQEEYYKSEKNILKVIVETYNSIENTEQNIKGCTQASGEAQAIFGGSAMRVCVDVQIIKIAAQYMEMLLAQIQQEASLEIQNWADIYKLPDYNRDYTKFNLDDYVLTKDDLKKNLKSMATGAIGDAMMKFKGF